MKAGRIAVVVQRYGTEVNGGAESAARWLAEHLVSLAEVHVLTTCAQDYTTWANVYPAGESLCNGVFLHRFPVDVSRRWTQAQVDTGRFLLAEHTVEEELAWIRTEGPFSSGLLSHIRHSADDYDAFIFFTYLYATTVFALPLVAHKAILVPTAHDEPFLYLDAYRAIFHLPQHLVFLTQAEKSLVQQVTGNGHIPSSVAAVGVQQPDNASASRFRERYAIQGDFMLYGGRISDAKNVPELISYFQRYRAGCAAPLKLVLMGKPHIPLPQHADIEPIGFVSEADKFDALRAASVVVLPSHLESLSIIVLEAWLMETCVLVNGKSDVLRQQCRYSNGGLYYTSYDEFASALDLLLGSASLRQQLGRQGRNFVLEHYKDDVIIDQYASILQSVSTVAWD